VAESSGSSQEGHKAVGIRLTYSRVAAAKESFLEWIKTNDL
jgi:hypothetical protein